MEQTNYYVDQESGLEVSSKQGKHFEWYLVNKLSLEKSAYDKMDELNRELITSAYIADYIPR